MKLIQLQNNFFSASRELINSFHNLNQNVQKLITTSHELRVTLIAIQNDVKRWQLSNRPHIERLKNYENQPISRDNKTNLNTNTVISFQSHHHW